MHYPSQTAGPSRGFPDFHLRAPAASMAEPESGSTTEVSESEEDEERRGEESTSNAAQDVEPGGSASTPQQAEPQEASASSEWHQN